MRRAFFAATALFSFAAIAQSSLAAEAPYIDDRSDAASVINSLYSAINRHEFARAWDYFGDTKPAKDFDTFVKGYDGTEKVEVKTGNVSERVLPAASISTSRLPSRRPPRTAARRSSPAVTRCARSMPRSKSRRSGPIFIDKGALKPATADFEEAVPASCGDGPPPAKKDAALEQAKKAFAAAYGDQCDKEAPGTGNRSFFRSNTRTRMRLPVIPKGKRGFSIFHARSQPTMKAPSTTWRMRFPVSGSCNSPSRNWISAMKIMTATANCWAMTIIGFHTTGWAVNSDYDEDTRTISHV